MDPVEKSFCEWFTAAGLGDSSQALKILRQSRRRPVDHSPAVNTHKVQSIDIAAVYAKRRLSTSAKSKEGK